jgi:hypothetical protein
MGMKSSPVHTEKLSGANVFEISDVQEDESRGDPNKPQCDNVSLHGKTATVSIRQRSVGQ